MFVRTGGCMMGFPASQSSPGSQVVRLLPTQPRAAGYTSMEQ